MCKASIPRGCLDAPILHRTTLICFPQRLRLDEGHFRLVAPMRLQPIQPKFQIVDARRIGLACQRLDKSARLAKPVRTRNSSHNLCFQVPSTARRNETIRDSLVAAFAILEFRFLANVRISFLPDAFNVPRRMQRLIVAESSYVSLVPIRSCGGATALALDHVDKRLGRQRIGQGAC